MNTNSLLANIRWLCVPSDNLGQDWYEKSLEIDSHLEANGMDLAEEVTYLLYSVEPQDVLNGQGKCLIGRPVIGPKKVVDAPFVLIDWKAAPVWRETAQGNNLQELLLSGAQARLNALKAGEKTMAKPFFLAVHRQLTPELKLWVETIFHE